MLDMVRLSLDAAYLMVVRISPTTEISGDAEIVVETQWRSLTGFLSAIDRPLLTFYGLM